MHSYLSDTLSSLMSELSPAEKNDCVIVVLIAEVSGSPPPTVAMTTLLFCILTGSEERGVPQSSAHL